MFTECCERSTWADMRRETVPDSWSSSAAAWKAQELNDKLDRATDKTLAEADHKALVLLYGFCRWSKLARYGGLLVFKALKASVAILTSYERRWGLRSQWPSCVQPRASKHFKVKCIKSSLITPRSSGTTDVHYNVNFKSMHDVIDSRIHTSG